MLRDILDTDKIMIHFMFSNLSPRLKEPIYLKYSSRLNAAKAGQALICPPATICTRLRTAIKMIRGIMEGDLSC